MKPLLITSAVMLFLGMFSGWPYGYYTLLRFVIFIVGCLITMAAHKMQRHGLMVAIGLIAVLFNPVIPVHLDKTTWRIIDFMVGVVFLILLFKIRKREE